MLFAFDGETHAQSLGDSLDAPGFAWTTGGHGVWQAQTNVTHDGLDAAQSAAIANQQTNWLATSVSGPGTIGFWWKVSSETNSDRLAFFIDAVSQRTISGEQDWQFLAFDLSEGIHELRWVYRKDSVGSRGLDRGWVDDVMFATSAPPAIMVQPAAQSCPAGQWVVFQVALFGAGPFSYQWRHDGTELAGATNATLGLGNLKPEHMGDYSVAVNNAFGFALSSNANLTVLSGLTLEEALDTPDLVWTTGGNSFWFGQTNRTADGVDAAQNGLLASNQTNWIQTIVTGPGTVAFWWKVSSDPFDRLRFHLGPTLLTNISGERDWEFQAYPVPAGTQILRWSYGKDASISLGFDRGWVDRVVFLPPSLPVILVQPVPTNAVAGTAARFSVAAAGDMPLHYQWRRDGAELAGATNASFLLVNLQPNQHGEYSVVISNQLGMVVSSNATLGVLPGITLEEAVDTPNLILTTGGNGFWLAQTAITADGVDAAQSAVVAGRQTNWLETTVVGPGQLSFWWRVSSRPDQHYLTFHIGTALQTRIAGAIDWRKESFLMPDGLQTLRWAFGNDSYYSAQGANRGWLDLLSFAPPGPPVIVLQPQDQTVLPGSRALFSVEANSYHPLTYQWRKNTTDLPGATNDTLVLSNMTATATGEYSVVVQNQAGSVTSRRAIVTVTGTLDPNTATIGPVGQLGGYPGDLLVRGNYAYMGQGPGLRVVDLANRAQPLELSTLPLSGEVTSLCSQGDFAYAILSSQEFVVLSLTNAPQPVVVGRCRLTENWQAARMAAVGSCVYVAAGTLKVVSVADPAAPQFVTNLTLNAHQVFAVGQRAYVLTSTEMRILDVADPLHPVVLGSHATGGRCLWIQGDYAYVGDTNGLKVLNVSSPSSIIAETLYDADGGVESIVVSGALACLWTDGGPIQPPLLRALDLANPRQPQPRGRMNWSTVIHRLAADPPWVFFTQPNGLEIVNTSDPANLTVAAESLSPPDVNQTFVAGEYLYLATSTGPWVYSLANPAQPQLVRAYTNAPYLWRLYVADNLLYEIFADPAHTNRAATILDASDPAALTPIGSSSPYLDHVIMDLAVQSNRLYWVTKDLTGLAPYFTIIDVRNPANPRWFSPGWQCPGNGRVLAVSGNWAAVGWAATIDRGVSILDVSDPAAPSELSRVRTVGLPTCLHWAGSQLFIGSARDNSTWLLEVFDLANPSAPSKITSTSGDGCIWGVEKRGDFVFSAVVGQSVLIFDYAHYLLSQASVCHSPASLGLATTLPDATGRGYIYTPEGYGNPSDLSKSGSSGVAVQSYWIGGSPGRTAVLTLGGGKPGQMFYPDDPRLTNDVEVLDVTLAADVVSAWTVHSIQFGALGAQGLDDTDIDSVRLFHGQQLLGEQRYPADNGQVRLPVGKTIPAGTSLTLKLCYRFRLQQLQQPPYTKNYQAQTMVTWIAAEPQDPTVTPLKLPPEPVYSGVIQIVPVMNLDTEEVFESIQDAIDAAKTLDGHMIMAWANTFWENVKLTKALILQSEKGPEQTVIWAMAPGDHAVAILKAESQLVGFTIEGATGPNRAGIYVHPTVPGVCTITANRIRDNACGVYFDRVSEVVLSNNVVVQNQQMGVHLFESGHNLIAENVISSNGTHGLVLEGPGATLNQIQKNILGATAERTNAWPNGGHGIFVTNAPGNTIGGDARTNANLIAWNDGDGIHLAGALATRNLIQGNHIQSSLGDAIRVQDAPGNRIGGSSDNSMPFSGNLIGLCRNGVHLAGVGASNNVVSENRILENEYGVWVDDAPRNTIGSPGSLGDAESNDLRYQNIYWNRQAGIIISGAQATGNAIIGNEIGFGFSGIGPAGNEGSGVIIFNAPGNMVGGTNSFERGTIEGNFIAYNKGYGVQVRGASAQGNRIMHNTIGHRVGNPGGGASWYGNKLDGIFLESAGENLIDGNWIEGNRHGICLFGEAATRNTILRNNANNNTQSGLVLSNAPANVIESCSFEQNTDYGIWIYGANSTSNLLVGNTAYWNYNDGLLIEDGNNNLIGDIRSPGITNKFVENRHNGIRLTGASAYQNRIEGNFIDGNNGNGIEINEAVQTDILGNWLKNNASSGVRVLAGSRNLIVSNRFSESHLIAIDLEADDVTANDFMDLDGGANLQQNYPELEAAHRQTGVGTFIAGRLQSASNTMYLLEFYATSRPHSSEYGAGEEVLLSYRVRTGSLGEARFVVRCPSVLSSGFVTATATDPMGNTSEFSRCVAVAPAEDTDQDGTPNILESNAPNQGDANRDGIPDSQQDYVVSTRTFTDQWLTLVAPTNAPFTRARAVENPSPTNSPPGVEFPLGLLDFALRLTTPGAGSRIEFLLPDGVSVNAYYKFGPTPDNPTNHWYRFDFDGQTGAIIESNKLILYLVDGQRGDDDITVNGFIYDVGGPAWAPTLRLFDPQLLANGSFRFRLSTLPGQSYSIEVSERLTNWIELLTTNALGDTLHIEDTTATPNAQRFYRVRSP
jgi:parallel beta-helix repeat protein